MSTTLTKYLKLSIILFCLTWVLFTAMGQGIFVNYYHVDGNFQTASGLFRLASGQFPGKNFFPYLGIGPLFLLYPFFTLFGGNFTASVISAKFLVLITGWLSVSLIWHLIWRPKSFTTSVVAGAIIFILPIALWEGLQNTLPYIYTYAKSPGNSLRPFRGQAPYIVALLYYFFILKINSKPIKYTVCGILTGLILLWTNDFAIPTAGLFALLLIVKAYYNQELKYLILYIFTALISWLVILSLVTLGHPIAILKYNFLDVTKDQWWYFSYYQTPKRFFNVFDIPKLFLPMTYLPLIVLAITACTAIKIRAIELTLLLWIGLVLFAGGAVASIGGHIGGYFDNFNLWGYMTFVIGLFRLSYLGFKKLPKPLLDNDFNIAVTLIFCLFSLIIAINAYMKFKFEISMAKNNAKLYYNAELGGYVGKEWRDYFNFAKQNHDRKILEEYWGLWSAQQRIFPSWPVDSTIHALGDIRDIAASQIHQADFIITTRYQISNKIQPWNISENYWLYGELFKNWTPVFFSPTTVVWRKTQTPRLFKSIACIIDNENPALILKAPQPGFYEIDMNYVLSNSGRILLLVKNNISYAGDASGYVSLNPKATNFKFPVYIFQKGRNLLAIKVESKSNYHLDITGCTARQIPLKIDDVLHIPSATPPPIKYPLLWGFLRRSLPQRGQNT